ncbi:MAG: adenylate cyclase, partial [Microcystis panniformis]
MFNQLDWNPAYSIETLEPNTVFFLSERESICFQEPLYYRLVRLIDGQRNLDEIIDILQLEFLQNQEINPNNPNSFAVIINYSLAIQKAIFQLYKRGFLLEKKELLPSNLAILCYHLQVSQDQAFERLQSLKVTVKSLGSIPQEDLINILNSLQVQVADEGDLTIILTDNYLHPDLDSINQQALASHKPWLLVNPLGNLAWIGP